MENYPMARKNVSKRHYQDSAGEKSVGPASDGRVIFALLGTDGSTLKEFDSSALNEKARAMFAQFGFVTKVGNVANSVLNGDDPGTPEDAAADIEEFLAGLAMDPPVWREPGEGRARGPKYDKDVLASVLYEGRSAEKRTGDWADVATIRARLDDKSFYAKVRNNAGAMASYYKAMAERGAAAQTATVDDLG
jgi:hypothetical protein